MLNKRTQDRVRPYSVNCYHTLENKYNALCFFDRHNVLRPQSADSGFPSLSIFFFSILATVRNYVSTDSIPPNHPMSFCHRALTIFVYITYLLCNQ